MITNHPTPEMLSDYTAGALRLSHALCVATHLDHCHSCRQAVSRLEALGAHYFTSSTDRGNNSEALDAIKASLFKQLAQTDEQDNNVGMTDVLAMKPDTRQKPLQKSTGTKNKLYRVPRSLGQFIDTDYEHLDWTPISPSIKLAVLCRDKDGSQIALTRVKAGGKMPHHSHTGDEITVVLEGAFSDEQGLYKKGDMVCRGASHKHTPLVTNDAECICLAVLDSPIQFTGFFTRLLNPFVRRHHG